MRRQILERRWGALPAAAAILLLCLGPPTLSAQSTKKDDDPETKPGSSRSSAQNREQKPSGSPEKDRARHDAERREREERREIRRRQDAMREADLENAAQRQRQDAEWAREMERQRQRDQPTPNPTYRAPSASPAQRAPGPYGAPAATSVPRQDTDTSRFTCSAHPSCPSETGRGNVCKGVQGSYTGAGARNDGLRDIVTRCREANLPELCNTDPRGTPSRPNYRLTTTSGCAQQCATVARCSPITAR